jgi:hypothetical protein
MSLQHPTHYKDVPGWRLSDSFWLRIKPLLPKPASRFPGRGNKRKNVGGSPLPCPSQTSDGRHSLGAANWLSVECCAERIWLRQNLAL